MSFEIAPLPYPTDALAPTLSAVAVEIHYEKHHKAYLAKLRKLTEGRPEASSSLVELIQTANGEIFNNAAQLWNHSFYWQCMRPGGGGTPTGALLAALERGFGSFADFRAQFAAAANGEFGSGWAWLMLDAMGTLRVASSDDADNPLQRGSVPLLALDVWEHAYYVDYRNERGRYVEGFLNRLVSWEFVAANLDAAERARASSPNQGEGDAVADAAYRAAATAFAASGRVEAAAREAVRGEKA
ncbi:MAG: superoxide dismutase [Myxococcota bacterium]|jgi:Fe-Mn family superoxide dismutase